MKCKVSVLTHYVSNNLILGTMEDTSCLIPWDVAFAICGTIWDLSVRCKKKNISKEAPIQHED